MEIRICLAFYSGAGHTRRLAEAIAAGAEGAATRLVDVTKMTKEDWRALDDAHAIVFGSPTFMGSTAAAFDSFLEEAAATRWPDPGWTDKIAAGFTVASHPSGDKMIVLQRLQTYAAQMGMIWVGQTSVGAPVFPDREGVNRDGAWTGLMATSSRDKSVLIERGDMETASLFGARIAAATARWNK
jgi:NAD(P)H dehydrogenase (quinone)